MNLLFFLLVLTAGPVLVLHLCIKGNKAYRATCAYCDASNAFFAWYLANPGVCVSLSDLGRNLLIEYIDAYKEWLESHPFIDDNGHLQQLTDLLNEPPPTFPDSIPPRTLPALCPLFFLQNVLRWTGERPCFLIASPCALVPYPLCI